MRQWLMEELYIYSALFGLKSSSLVVTQLCLKACAADVDAASTVMPPHAGAAPWNGDKLKVWPNRL
jgi:hypothetical protein